MSAWSIAAGVRNQDARVQPKPEAQDDVAEPDFLAEGQEVSATTNITTLAILNFSISEISLVQGCLIYIYILHICSIKATRILLDSRLLNWL